MLARNYFFFGLLLLPAVHYAQETTVHGFGHTEVALNNDDFSFKLGELDLFIASDLNDNFSVLGEIVYKFSSESATLFNVSIERLVIKYNFYGNHNLLVGKRHTPVDYWNDSYHHGRLFFPTIDRPVLFSFVPIHTLGVSLQAQNLGAYNLGYDIMIGNGMSSSDVKDFDKPKSLTISLNYKPKTGTQLRLAYYRDKLLNNSSGIHTGHSKHGNVLSAYSGDVSYQLYTLSIASFNPKFEFLSEVIMNKNKTDTLGVATNMGLFLYAGYRFKKIVPYVAFDISKIDPNDLHFPSKNLVGISFGARYEINYLVALKMEYKLKYIGDPIEGKFWDNKSFKDEIKIQLAIGF